MDIFMKKKKRNGIRQGWAKYVRNSQLANIIRRCQINELMAASVQRRKLLNSRKIIRYMHHPAHATFKRILCLNSHSKFEMG